MASCPGFLSGLGLSRACLISFSSGMAINFSWKEESRVRKFDEVDKGRSIAFKFRGCCKFDEDGPNFHILFLRGQKSKIDHFVFKQKNFVLPSSV